MTSFFNHFSYDKISRLFTILVILFWTLEFSSVSLEVWLPELDPGQSSSRSVPTTQPCAQLALQRDGTMKQYTARGEAPTETVSDWRCDILEAFLQAACRTDAGGREMVLINRTSTT